MSPSTAATPARRLTHLACELHRAVGAVRKLGPENIAAIVTTLRESGDQVAMMPGRCEVTNRLFNLATDLEKIASTEPFQSPTQQEVGRMAEILAKMAGQVSASLPPAIASA